MKLTDEITPALRAELNTYPHEIQYNLGRRDVPEIASKLGSGANQKARLRQAERWFTTGAQQRGILPREVIGHDWLDYRRRPKMRAKLTLAAGLSPDGLEYDRDGGTPGLYLDDIQGTLLQAADRCVDIIQGLANIDEYLMGSWFSLRIVPTRSRRWNVEIYYMSGMGADSKKSNYPQVADPHEWQDTEDEDE